jgi:hypothetical protein
LPGAINRSTGSDQRGQVELLEAWLRSADFNPTLIALQARTPPQDMAILTAAQLPITAWISYWSTRPIDCTCPLDCSQANLTSFGR